MPGLPDGLNRFVTGGPAPTTFNQPTLSPQNLEPYRGQWVWNSGTGKSSWALDSPPLIMIKCLVDHRTLFSLSRSSLSSLHSISLPFLGRRRCWSITVCHVIPGHWGTVFLRRVLPYRTLYTRKGRAHAHITRRGDRFRSRFFSGWWIDIPGHCFVNPGH